MYVCSAIKSAPSRESARNAPCQWRDLGARFLEGYRSPSCLVAEKGDVLRQFSAGRYANFNIIDRPFHYRSLTYLIRAMPVKGVGVHDLAALQPKKALPFFPRAETPFLIIGFWDFRLWKILFVVGKRSN